MRNLSESMMVIIGVGFLLLAGCASAPLQVEPIPRAENPTTVMEQLGQEISAARRKRVDLFSPTWFAEAQSSYEKARAGIERGTQLSDIMDNIAKGQAQLKQALAYAAKTESDLDNVIASRDAALKAGAEKYQKDFDKFEADFLKLARAVENEDGSYVQDKKKSVNDAYRALELRAIKDSALGEVRRLIAAAQSGKLDRVAPKSFLIAQSKLADAEAVIANNRYDDENITKALKEALFYARRMDHIAQTAAQFEKMSSEDVALSIEGRLARILAQLKQDDSRDLPFDGQQEVAMNAIAALYRSQASAGSQAAARNIEIGRLKERISDLEGRTYQQRVDTARLAADKERLAAEKRFNELYNQVQNYFAGDDAEVYKKGEELVIRLKAIQFPVGQSVILEKNYPLLTTVQKAIDAFGKPDVLIEGHSDSTGSEALNQQLSQKRAEAVRQYLIHNGVLPEDKIAAIGYGSSRPLASNQTAQGRAINRRIDVILTPVK